MTSSKIVVRKVTAEESGEEEAEELEEEHEEVGAVAV